MAYEFDGTDLSNNEGTTLAVQLAAGTAAPTTVTLATGGAAQFSNITLPAVFTLAGAAETETSAIEVVRVTAFVGDVATVSARALYGTTAQTWAVGSKFDFRLLGDHVTQVQDAVNDLESNTTPSRAYGYLQLSEQYQ